MVQNYLLTNDEQPYEFTLHARLRMAQWNLRESEVLYAIRYGEKFHRHGILFHFLREKDVAKKDPRLMSRLEGVTVLTSARSRTVITVYRNRKAINRIKRKVRYNNKGYNDRWWEDYDGQL